MLSIRSITNWLDDRTGYRNLAKVALDEEVPGGASFAYVFGSVLTFIFVLQATTGVMMALYYSPSASDSWASVAYIQDQVTLGWFVRGLHSYGASAMVIIAGLHMLQTALWGAYKAPRELNWIIGVIMLGVILAFALTGYLLPWDQKGYWATKVATGIAGISPVIGDKLQQGIQAGNEYGNLTLTRFYGIHVFILPGTLIALLVAHIGLFRRHGVTPHWWLKKQRLSDNVGRFWPDQLFRDIVAIAAVFVALVAINIYTHGAELGAPADASSNFDARPEWYFRPLFQLLKYFEGSMETVVALGIPPIVGGLLFALPFLDRKDTRNPRTRVAFLAIPAALFVLAGMLTVVSFSEDANDEELQERIAKAEERAELARRLAREYGVPAAGGIAVYTTAPHYEAKQIFNKECASCHRGKKRKGPELVAGYNSRTWIHNFLLDPGGDLFFGRTEDHEMKPTDLRGQQLEAVIEAVYAQTGADDADEALAAKGLEIFEDGECSNCHTIDEVAEGDTGPNLFQRGTAESLAELIGHAASDRWYGKDTEMPSFRDDFSRAERLLVAEWLRSLQSQPYGHPKTTPGPVEKKPADDGGDDEGDDNEGDDEGDSEGDEPSDAAP